MSTTYLVPADEPPITAPMSDDLVILVLDPDADEIVRPAEINEIVREP